MPIVMATSYLFNYYLVPKFLLLKSYGKFILYLLYMIIISLYLELIVVYLAFIYLANYNVIDMPPLIRNVWILTLTLYVIVFVQGFILLLKKFQSSESMLIALENEKQKNAIGYLTVKSDRQNKRISFDEILYIESLADYVQIQILKQPPVITKQKISHIQQELTDDFMRIHRSFIVNKKHISSHGADHVMLDTDKLPVSRTYKKAVKALLLVDALGK